MRVLLPEGRPVADSPVHSAQMVLPGPPPSRGAIPHRSANCETRKSPRPDSASGSGIGYGVRLGAGCGCGFGLRFGYEVDVGVGLGCAATAGRRSERVSVTSTRRVNRRECVVSAVSESVSRRWKSRPGTCPWRTAFAVSSAVMSVIVSLTSEVYGYPHSSSRYATNRRPSRAPRGVEVNRIANSRTVGEVDDVDEVEGADEVHEVGEAAEVGEVRETGEGGGVDERAGISVVIRTDPGCPFWRLTSPFGSTEAACTSAEAICTAGTSNAERRHDR